MGANVRRTHLDAHLYALPCLSPLCFSVIVADAMSQSQSLAGHSPKPGSDSPAGNTRGDPKRAPTNSRCCPEARINGRSLRGGQSHTLSIGDAKYTFGSSMVRDSFERQVFGRSYLKAIEVQSIDLNHGGKSSNIVLNTYLKISREESFLSRADN